MGYIFEKIKAIYIKKGFNLLEINSYSFKYQDEFILIILLYFRVLNP